MGANVAGGVSGAASGAQLGSMILPGYGTAIGAVAGGLMGMFGGSKGKKQKPIVLEKAGKIGQVDNVFGTATDTNVNLTQDPNQLASVKAANQQLAQQVQQGLNQTQNTVAAAPTLDPTQLLAGVQQIDPQRLQAFQQAYVGARQPQLDRQLAQQQNQLNINSAVRGTSGGSSDILAQALQSQFANEQNNRLQNQSILGGESLANQALQQQLGIFGAGMNAFGGQLTNQAQQTGLNAQQDQRGIANQLSQLGFLQNLQNNNFNQQQSATALLGNAYNNAQSNAINIANQHNSATLGQSGANIGVNTANQATGNNNLANIFGGGTAGANLFNGVFGGSKKSSVDSGGISFNGGSGGSVIGGNSGYYDKIPAGLGGF